MNLRKKDLWISRLVLFVLLVCFGCILYGYLIKPPTLSAEAPEILLPSKTGPVLFTHTKHFSEDGAALECTDCHHNASGTEGDTSEMRCRTCHYNNQDVVETVCSDNETHPRCIGTQCMICHDGEECSFCHRKPVQ